LDLTFCKSIQSLPTTIGDLKHLTKLKLGGCENVGTFFKPLEAFLHYQYWTYLIASPFNHCQQQMVT